MEIEPNMHQCTKCGWSIDEDDRATEHERNQRAIEHHIETGHTIVSRTLPARLEEAGDDGSEGRHRVAE